jgi:uncharacterized membrane protein YeaQ/YmgE (transglycosylase-associated protein family)
MGILAWILFGLIAGAVAKFLIVTILIGIAGAVIGGFLASFLGFGGATSFDFRSLLVAIGGAMLLLLGYRALRR